MCLTFTLSHSLFTPLCGSQWVQIDKVLSSKATSYSFNTTASQLSTWVDAPDAWLHGYWMWG